METAIEFISSRNPLMLLLFALSVVCLAVILDKLLFWMASALRYRPIPPEIYDSAGSRKELVVQQLKAEKNKHYTRAIFLTCLQPSVNEDQISQTVSEQVAIMSSRLGMLDLFAKIAPLVGILGTVIGMAVSFGGIGAMVTASPAAISNGISIALRTTAYGLIISIAASIASAAFRRCTQHAILKMGRIVCEIQRSHKIDNS